MSLATLSFDIDGNAAGFVAATSEVEKRLEAMEKDLAGVKAAAEETSKGLGNVGKSVNVAFAVQAVKAFSKAVQEVARFVYDSAKAAADAGNGPMKQFVGNVEKIHNAFRAVGAQAASQLLPVLQRITDAFLNSKEAAKGLRDAGNFIADVFRVLISAGAIVAGVFDVVGTSIAAAASMIVSALSGDFTGALDTFRSNLEEVEKTGKRVGSTISAAWEKGQDFKGGFKGGGGDGGAKKAAAYKLSSDEVVIDIDARKMNESFAAIGESSEKTFARVTDGFANHSEAVASWADKTKRAASAMAEANRLTQKNKLLEAEYAKVNAEASKRAAEEALRAAEAFAASAEAALSSKDTFGGAMAAFGTAVLQTIPRLNELVNAAAQGAQAGGVWGALIAVFVQLISETEAFQTIIDLVNGNLDQLIGGLEPLVEAFAGIMEAINPMTEALTSTVTSSLRPIGAILKAIAPILKIVMSTFKILTPILDLVGKLFDAIGKALDEFAAWIDDFLTKFDNFFKGKGFKSNAELAAADEYRASAPHEQFASSNAGMELDANIRAAAEAVKKAEAATLYAAKYNTTEAEMAALWKAEADANAAVQKAQEEYNKALGTFMTNYGKATKTVAAIAPPVEDFTKALIKATAALTNVPSGYKVAIARMEATQAVGAMSMGSIAPDLSGLATTAPRGGGGGDVVTFTGPVTIVAQDPEEFERKMRRRAFTRKGAAFGGG